MSEAGIERIVPSKGIQLLNATEFRISKVADASSGCPRQSCAHDPAVIVLGRAAARDITDRGS
jgi:hypothetical protein